MGRQDFFEVWLQTPSLQNLPVVEHDQQRWFVGEPGAEFIVRVNAVLYSGHPYRVRPGSSLKSAQHATALGKTKLCDLSMSE
jgi:hypothetical protein